MTDLVMIVPAWGRPPAAEDAAYAEFKASSGWVAAVARAGALL